MSGPLLVFDFDHTIADLNTDVEVQKLDLSPRGQFMDLNTDVEVQKLAPGGEVPASSELRGRRG